ncbi:MAG: hypothetical protein HN368_09980 [Spirochaetales bacterium]|jgi:hypothetical protein|nr:hypothetical protein [Spirochaetales bacterium]
MKKTKQVALAALLFIASASTAFGFEWISLSEPDANMTVSGSIGYGHLIFAPVGILPAGVKFEIAIPGIDNLYAGAGAGYLNIKWNDILGTSSYSLQYLEVDAYAKYIILTRAKAEDLIGMPLFAGAAAGFGFQFALGNFAGYALSEDYGGIGGLAVGLVGYDFGKSSLTAYGGLVDRTFGYSAEYNYRIADSMHIGLFWVPLLGIGVHFTMQL